MAVVVVVVVATSTNHKHNGDNISNRNSRSTDISDNTVVALVAVVKTRIVAIATKGEII